MGTASALNSARRLARGNRASATCLQVVAGGGLERVEAGPGEPADETLVDVDGLGDVRGLVARRVADVLARDAVVAHDRYGGVAAFVGVPVADAGLAGGGLERVEAGPGEPADETLVDVGEPGMGEVVAQVVEVGPGVVGADGLADGLGEG